MFRGLSASSKFFFSLFIILISVLVTFIVGAIIAIPLFNVNFFINPEVISPDLSENINISKYFQIVSAIGIFIIPPIVISYLLSSEKLSYIGIGKTPQLISLIIVAFSIFAIIPVIDFLAYVNSGMSFPESLSWVENWMREKEDMALVLTQEFLYMDGISDFMINMVMLAIIPAVGEEFLFRGVFQRIFSDWTKNVHVSIFITAVLFSAFHFQFYGFLPRLVLGLFLGYLFLWSKNIWLPVFGHFVNNATAVIYYYFSSQEVRDGLLDGREMEISISTVLISGTAFILLSFLIYRKERNLLKI